MRWPVTITVAEDRYGGTYSGGEWLAFYGDHERTSDGGDLDDAYGSDPDCAEFFASPAADEIGVGNTPSEALAELLRRRPEPPA